MGRGWYLFVVKFIDLWGKKMALWGCPKVRIEGQWRRRWYNCLSRERSRVDVRSEKR